MTSDQYQQKRRDLLDKKFEVEARLASTKEAITKAKRHFAATRVRADSDWLTRQEAYARRLGVAAQELQRQLGDLKTEFHHAIHDQSAFEHFLHQLLCERMPLEEVTNIFAEARHRKKLFDAKNDLDTKP